MKQFKCGNDATRYVIDDAIYMAFGHQIAHRETTKAEVYGWLDTLDIGETLYDEDDDKWTRIA
ncbi:MAG: hypothetical protein G3W72_20795 [Xanthomonas perforans]|nr:hypothetical protein [Xanthomonas perforans]NEL40303.1 hypothetical protein [Xanthomonas perforans]NEL65378.1 hypothetical protein [Xanthomonas perforans]NEM12847.1 hypothetical protein [Xanthomonas perforans]